VILLLPVLAVALLLRLWGLAQGYPDFYGHVDEIGVAASIWNFFRSGTLQPTEFTYPALYQYLVAAGIWATAVSGMLDLPDGGGLVAGIAFVSYVDPGWSALVGRSLSAIAATGVVAVLYRLGRDIEGRSLGLTAAAFGTVAVIPLRHAHQALPDSLASLLGAGVLWAAWHVAMRGQWRDYIASGVCTGLLLATKYNGALCALAVVAAHGWRCGARRTLFGVRLWAAGILALVVCLMVSPYLLLAYEQYLGVARYQVSSLGFTLRQTSPWWWIARGLVAEELIVGGWILAGVVLAMARRRAIGVISLAAILPAVLYIGSWTRESLHYLLPYYPFLLILAAGACLALCRRIAARPYMTLAVVCLSLVPSMWRGAGDAGMQKLPDTRALAADWIKSNVPDGSTLGMTWLPYCPHVDLAQTRRDILQHYESQPAWQNRLRQSWAHTPSYRIVNLEAWLSRPVVPEALRSQVDLDDPETRRVFSRGWRSRERLKTDGVEFLVLPAAVYERYLADGEPPSAPAARFRYLLNQSYFQGLLNDSRSEKLVSLPHAGQPARGSQIDIYRLLGP
jgi:hypothetical protein